MALGWGPPTPPPSVPREHCCGTSATSSRAGYHLGRPTIRRSDRFLWLDEMTRRNLELVEPLRAGAKGVTLLEILDRTVTPDGRPPAAGLASLSVA